MKNTTTVPLFLLVVLATASASPAQSDSTPPGVWQRFTTRAKSFLARPATARSQPAKGAVQRADFEQVTASSSAVQPAAAVEKPPKPKAASNARRGAKPRRTVSEFMSQERP